MATMKFFSTKVIVIKIVLVVACLALADRKSDALFLGNIIGCNSFGCRLSALEADVGQLKQQVARLGSGTQPMNQGGFNQGMNQGQQGQNQGLNQGQFNQNQNQLNQNQLQNQLNNQLNQQQGQQQGTNQQQLQDAQNGVNRVNYANLGQEYSGVNQPLRRVPNYPTNGGLGNQFFSA